MVPVEQTCPSCHRRHLGSDIVGLPCANCMGINETALMQALNQMRFIEEENEDE
jgi:hypothetical protein